ncbi:LamG domain-containing protein, partial [Bacteroidetes/Chlorobi group bacterium Naka2016]
MKPLKILITIFLLTFNIDSLLSQDLLAHWSFDDGTARDVTGNGYDGILVNNPTVVQGVAGNALHFQGKGYYIPANGDVKQIGSHVLLPPINLHSLKEFTITMWVYHEGFSHYHGNSYFWFGHHQYGYLGIINTPFLNTNDTKYYLQFSVGGVYFTQNIISTEFQQSFVKSWVCYAMVYKDANLKVYINGNLIASQNIKVNYFLQNFALGRIWWLWDGEERTAARFTGAIDEVKIYLRALSDDEISLECQSCGPMSFAYD